MGKGTSKLRLAGIFCTITLSVVAFFLYAITHSNLYLFGEILILLLYILTDWIVLSKQKKSNGGIIPFGEMKELKERTEDQASEIEFLYEQSKAVDQELKATLCRITDIQQELEIKNQELDILKEASEIITSTFDVNRMIEYLYGIFNRFAGCDRYFVCLIDPGSGELVCKYEFGQVCFNEVGQVYAEESSVKSCFRKGHSFIKVNEIIKNRNCYGDKMAIPLFISQKLIGVIYLESGCPGSFRNVNLKFLENLSNYAAIAIHNAELFNDVYMQKQEIESLYEQTAAVNEQLNSSLNELKITKEELAVKNAELTRYYNEIQTGYLQTVTALANSIQAKDAYTMGHCQRVMEIACQIAAKMGFSDEKIEELRYSAILHDIGKIGIPASILNKKGKLTEEEYDEIKKHPKISYGILKEVEFIKSGLSAILQHHERFDGKGYPNGLKGNQISVEARILCIADAFDAMTSDRPYRKAMTMEEALAEIERCKGTQFDPEIVDLFVRLSMSSV